MKENRWARLLTYVTGLINQELLLKNEYLAAENRILRAHLPTRLRLADTQFKRQVRRANAPSCKRNCPDSAARSACCSNTGPFGEVGLATGFQSSSAFSTAFTRAVRIFAEAVCSFSSLPTTRS
jgi:AraC-like DNA-binding protein